MVFKVLTIITVVCAAVSVVGFAACLILRFRKEAGVMLLAYIAAVGLGGIVYGVYTCISRL